MAGEGGGVIRELVARFSLQADEKSVKNADDVLDKLMDKVKQAATLFAGLQFGRFIASIIDEADALNDVAERIGTTTQALQGLGFAANMVGSDTEGLNQGLKFLTKTMAEAEGGSKEAKKAFSALGVSYKNADGSFKKSDALFLEIADSLAKVEDPTKRAALSMGVFSRAGQELAPLLAKGSDAIRDMQTEFRALGGEFSDDFVQASAEAKDNMDRLRAVMKGVGQAMAQGVLPVVLKLQSAFVKFWKENGPAIRERLTKAFQAVGVVMEGLGNIVEMLGKAFMGLVAAWEEGGTPLRVLMTYMGILLATSLGILAPWLLIAAAIALAVEDLYVFATGGESVIGTLVDQLYAFVTEGGTALHAFVAMVLDLLTTLRDEGFGALWNEVGEMLKTAATYWGEVIDGFVATIADAFSAMLKETADLFVDTIKGIVSDFLSLWTGAISGAVNGIKKLLGIETDVTVSHEQPQGPAFKDVPGMPWRKKGAELAQTVDAYGAGANNTPSGVTPKSDSGQGMPDLTAVTPGVTATDLAKLGSMFGTSPEARPPIVASPDRVQPTAGAASSTVYAPQTSTQVTVNAAPGMDEQALTDLMITKIDERVQEHNSAAFSAVVGATR